MEIEIVTTPNETLKETGFGAHIACQGVMQSLLGSKHKAIITVCQTVDDLDSIVIRKPDLVILVVKYILLEDGHKLWLSNFFETNNVNYTGSQKINLLYDSDKISAKILVASKGIDTADYFITIPGQYKAAEDLPLPFPLFIKPSDAANGNGVDIASLVHDFSHFQDKVKILHDEYDEPILVETYLDGMEFTVAVIESQGELIVAPVEVIPPEEGDLRILGAKTKIGNTEILKLITDGEILIKVMDVARKSFRALGARDFGRIDVKMDHHGKCHFIEANLVPGMKKDSSYFPRACEMNYGLDYDAVVGLMIQGAIGRLAHLPGNDGLLNDHAGGQHAMAAI